LVASEKCWKRRRRRIEVLSMLGGFSKRSRGLAQLAEVVEMLVIEDGECEAMNAANDEVEHCPGEAATARFAREATRSSRSVRPNQGAAPVSNLTSSVDMKEAGSHKR
jgi:hypothetical protein